jgi:adenylate cyclase
VVRSLALLGSAADPPAPVASVYDLTLAGALRHAPVALGAVPIEGEPTPPIRGPFGLAAVGTDPTRFLLSTDALEAPLPELVAAAQGFGLAGVGDGRSAKVRRQPMMMRVSGEVTPTLTLEALRLALGARSYVLRASDAGESAGGTDPVLTEIRLGPLAIPVSPDGTLWLRFAGEQPARTIPAWRILAGAAPDPAVAAAIEGRIVLIGATAPGLRYLAATPLSPAVDGVEVQAEVLEQVLEGVSLSRPDWAPGLELLLVALAGLLVFVAVNDRPLALGAALTALLAAATVGGAWVAFQRQGLLISPLTPTMLLGAGFAVLTALNYLRSAEQGAVVRSQFERFVAPQVIQSLIEDPELQKGLTGEQREITLMFIDARGFTTLSEKMEPAALIAYLNRILDRVSGCILSHGGTIDKFMGDGIMAFWNAPVADPRHARRAVECAYAIRDARDALNVEFAAEGLPHLRLGVGVNTGTVSVGLIGSAERLDYSCIGDAVNLASRLQDLTKAWGVFNIIGDRTARAVSDWPFVTLGAVAVRGRSQVEPIHFALDPADPEPLARAVRAVSEAPDLAALEEALDRLERTRTPDLDGAVLARQYRQTRRATA